MRFLSNAHTHTTFCDGKSAPEEMLAAAEKLGFVSLGFSSHGAQGFDPDYCMAADVQLLYITAIRALQREQGTRAPRLWVGVEQDTLTPENVKAKNRRELDYVIGSTHYLEKDFHGECVAVDGDTAVLKRYVDEVLDGDGLMLAKRYFDMHVQSLLEDKPDIIGHFDLVRKYAAPLGLFDPEGTAYRRLAQDALERAFPCGGVLEVNTGSMARGTMVSPYPTQELLNLWRELGGKVTLTSDCHDAAKLDYAFDTGLKMIAKAGFSEVWRLGRGKALWEAERVAVARA